MRVARALLVGCLLAACLALVGCVTFCDEGQLQPYDPMGRTVPPPEHMVTRDGCGRTCVTVTPFDLLDAAAGD